MDEEVSDSNVFVLLLGTAFLAGAFLGSVFTGISLQSDLAACRAGGDYEQFAKELEADLLFYHGAGQGLHFLDENGHEWRIVVEPASAYVKEPVPERECVEWDKGCEEGDEIDAVSVEGNLIRCKEENGLYYHQTRFCLCYSDEPCAFWEEVEPVSSIGGRNCFPAGDGCNTVCCDDFNYSCTITLAKCVPVEVVRSWGIGGVS